MKKNFKFLAFWISFSICSSGYNAFGQNEQINWLTWEQAQELMKITKKKMLVDLYTEWCTMCKKMDYSTFKDPEVIKYLNQNFYVVKFNAEDRDNIFFKDRIYKFIPKGSRGYHELAVEIANGQLFYPTIVFIDEDLNIVQPIPGYQDADSFEMITNYWGGNFYKNTPWSKYQEHYKKK
ncbi:MAG TPA: thioredoxin family protein [Saprospiraceae bacterium]|nr:thioredoxin family protein [Saprospiraceae bacterium]